MLDENVYVPICFVIYYIIDKYVTYYNKINSYFVRKMYEEFYRFTLYYLYLLTSFVLLCHLYLSFYNTHRYVCRY